MSKSTKSPKGIINMIFRGIFVYLKNILSLSKIMLFPVFGQVIGIFLILYPVFLISQNMLQNVSSELISRNIVLIGLGLILSTIPGFFIFTKAFWEYMIAMISLNSITSNLIRHGQIKDFKIHSQTVKLRTKEYIGLLSILSLIWLVGLLFPFIILPVQSLLNIDPILLSLIILILVFLSILILSIVSIYLSLSFQVFCFEHISVFKTLKKSWTLVEGNFWRTFFLGAIMFIITGALVPAIFQVIAQKLSFIDFISQPFESYLNCLINSPEKLATVQNLFKMAGSAYISISDIAKILSSVILAIIITGFMLPLGSTCYTMLYFDIVTKKSFQSKKR